MAKKKAEDSALVEAAKTIGEVAGKIAVATGVAAPPAKPSKVKIPKLAPKNKSRLPRKEKKKQKKIANASK